MVFIFSSPYNHYYMRARVYGKNNGTVEWRRSFILNNRGNSVVYQTVNARLIYGLWIGFPIWEWNKTREKVMLVSD